MFTHVCLTGGSRFNARSQQARLGRHPSEVGKMSSNYCKQWVPAVEDCARGRFGVVDGCLVFGSDSLGLIPCTRPFHTSYRISLQQAELLA